MVSLRWGLGELWPTGIERLLTSVGCIALGASLQGAALKSAALSSSRHSAAWCCVCGHAAGVRNTGASLWKWYHGIACELGTPGLRTANVCWILEPHHRRRATNTSLRFCRRTGATSLLSFCPPGYDRTGIAPEILGEESMKPYALSSPIHSDLTQLPSGRASGLTRYCRTVIRSGSGGGDVAPAYGVREQLSAVQATVWRKPCMAPLQ